MQTHRGQVAWEVKIFFRCLGVDVGEVAGGEGFLVGLAEEGFLADLGRRREKKGFSQIVADKGADERRFFD